MRTKGKWEVIRQGEANIGITSKDTFIATASTINCGLVVAEANAQHIVKCVNSYDGLLAACKTALGAFDALKVIGADKDLPGYNRCLRELQAAIKEAEG